MFITDNTKSRFYDFIYQFESKISSEFGRYDFCNPNLRQYMDKSGIFLARLGKKNKKESNLYKQYILFDDKKPSAKSVANIENDSAHNLLRHIRNAMAHGNIDKKTKRSKYYIIKDYNKGNGLSMEGLILIDSFQPLINLLIASKR